MVLDTPLSRFKRRMSFIMLVLGVLGYFTFHAFNGNHGIFARKIYAEKVAGLQTQLDELHAQRKALDHRTALLRSESLDPDLLEERVRDALNLAHPNDVLILQKKLHQ